MTEIICSSLRSVQKAIHDYQPKIVLSICDDLKTFNFSAPKHIQHQIIEFDDVTEIWEGLPSKHTPPSRTHVVIIVEIAQNWHGSGNFLVHCHAGQSRSPAAAIIVVATCFPEQLVEFTRRFRDDAPWISPNRVMIEIADDALEMDGQLVELVYNMREPSMRAVTHPASIPIRC